MHDFDGEEIVVWGAGGSNYVTVGDKARIDAGLTPRTDAGKREVRVRAAAAAKTPEGEKTRKRAAALGGKKGNGQKITGGRRKPSVGGKQKKPRARG